MRRASAIVTSIMEIRLFLLLLMFAITRGQAKFGCDLCLHGICYQKTRLLANHNMSVNPVVAVDLTYHNLYFEDYDDSTLKFLSLSNHSVESTGLRHVNYFTVDQKTQTLYVHSWDNLLYKYYPGSNHSYSYNVGERLTSLYFKDVLYAWIGTRVYTLWLTQFKDVEPLIHLQVSEMVIDRRGDFYFCGCTSNIICHTYKLNAGAAFPYVFDNNTYFLATDKNDDVYFIDSYKTAKQRLLFVYQLNYDSNQLEEVGLFDPLKDQSLHNVKFDRDNNLIVTLQRTKNEADDDIIDHDNNDRVYHFQQIPWHCQIRKQPFNEYHMSHGEASIDVYDF